MCGTLRGTNRGKKVMRSVYVDTRHFVVRWRNCCFGEVLRNCFFYLPFIVMRTIRL